ncbi:hypothetical protein PAMP_000848 [Pampus punctatissimus]
MCREGGASGKRRSAVSPTSTISPSDWVFLSRFKRARTGRGRIRGPVSCSSSKQEEEGGGGRTITRGEGGEAVHKHEVHEQPCKEGHKTKWL